MRHAGDSGKAIAHRFSWEGPIRSRAQSWRAEDEDFQGSKVPMAGLQTEARDKRRRGTKQNMGRRCGWRETICRDGVLVLGPDATLPTSCHGMSLRCQPRASLSVLTTPQRTAASHADRAGWLPCYTTFLVCQAPFRGDGRTVGRAATQSTRYTVRACSPVCSRHSSLSSRAGRYGLSFR